MPRNSTAAGPTDRPGVEHVYCREREHAAVHRRRRRRRFEFRQSGCVPGEFALIFDTEQFCTAEQKGTDGQAAVATPRKIGRGRWGLKTPPPHLLPGQPVGIAQNCFRNLYR